MNNANFRGIFLEHVKNQIIRDYMTKKIGKSINKLKMVLFKENTS